MIKNIIITILIGIILILWILLIDDSSKPKQDKEFIIINGDTLEIITTIRETRHFRK